jgi:hypothetical protein
MDNLTADLTRAQHLTPAVNEAIDELFAFVPWDDGQVRAGLRVRDALAAAIRAIVEHVPPSPDRSAAIRKIREARDGCSAAISHHGKY